MDSLENYRQLIRKIRIRDFFDREKLKKFLLYVIKMKGNSFHLALSISIGIFIGLLVPMGLQTIVIIPIILLLRTNILLTYTATFISNPITIVPLYTLSFKIGEIVTDRNIQWEKIYEILENPTFSNMFDLGQESIIIFFYGAFIEAILGFTVSLVISYYIIKFFRLYHSHEDI
jgi:uncharacterized protein (DUF2062 family)